MTTMTTLYALILRKNYVEGGDTTDTKDKIPSERRDGGNGETTVYEIRDDIHFKEVMEKHCGKLVVVDYTASWCEPCRLMAPYFEEFASQYPDISFLKVDVDKCNDTATGQRIQLMPTFVFYRDMKPVKRHEGADKDELESKMREQVAQKEEDDVNLIPLFLVKEDCECLNDAQNHKFTLFLENADLYLESVSNDPKLLMSFVLSQPVNLYSLRVHAPAANGPKTLKLIVDPPNPINFEDFANENADWKQILQLRSDDLTGKSVNLMCSSFQWVRKFQIFVENNQSAGERTPTRIDNLVIVGAPAEATNVSEIERHRYGTVGHFLSRISMKLMKLASRENR